MPQMVGPGVFKNPTTRLMFFSRTEMQRCPVEPPWRSVVVLLGGRNSGENGLNMYIKFPHDRPVTGARVEKNTEQARN